MAKKDRVDKYTPPSVVRLPKSWKTILNMSKARGRYIAGNTNTVVNAVRDGVVGRYMLDDRWAGKGKKEAE